jgi:hypothetical protein
MSNHHKPMPANAWVFVGIALLILYPLSTGPFAWLSENVMPDWFGEWLAWAYYPLWWAFEKNHDLAEWMLWYISLWGVDTAI